MEGSSEEVFPSSLALTHQKLPGFPLTQPLAVASGHGCSRWVEFSLRRSGHEHKHTRQVRRMTSDLTCCKEPAWTVLTDTHVRVCVCVWSQTLLKA